MSSPPDEDLAMRERAPDPEPLDASARPTFIITVRQWFSDYFFGDDPTFGLALVPFCFLSMVLFTRHPLKTNFIFDEQEALLANPYVRSIADPIPKFRWVDAFYRDFWGLGPERSIGSYRPIPNLVWRALWGLGARDQTPFLHHWVNVLLHGVNGALVCVLAFRLTRNRTTAWLSGAAFTAAGVITEAVSGVVGIADVLGATGAIAALVALALPMSKRVGVLGGVVPIFVPAMPVAVFAATLFGLYSKESALCCVPLVPLFALLTAAALHPTAPRGWVRAIVAFVAAGGAFVLYVTLRRRMFPAPMPAELSETVNMHRDLAHRTFAAILRWYAQPTLPRDPLNNPLVNATTPERLAGALRVYARGLGQLLFPWTLSGDYSAPQEPIPERIVFPESIVGGLALLLPVPVALLLGLAAWRRRARQAPAPIEYTTNELGELVAKAPAPPGPESIDLRPIVGAALAWIAVSYFPVSNIPALLPTVRAERFWYFPVIGSSLVLGIGATKALAWARSPDRQRVDAWISLAATVVGLGAFGAVVAMTAKGILRSITTHPTFLSVATPPIYVAVFALGAWALWRLSLRAFRPSLHAGRNLYTAMWVTIACFFGVQMISARRHANDYADDLAFWDATRHSVPRSAKAHLNYSVMKGARGDLEERLRANRTALDLAPQWPMASIYLGDTLCRLHRAPEAWRHYVRGFELAPNDVNLIALAMQCLWDEKMLVDNSPTRAELAPLKDRYPGTWLEYLGRDILEHGTEHNGVDPKYRPRGYNEGPKDP